MDEFYSYWASNYQSYGDASYSQIYDDPNIAQMAPQSDYSLIEPNFYGCCNDQGEYGMYNYNSVDGFCWEPPLTNSYPQEFHSENVVQQPISISQWEPSQPLVDNFNGMHGYLDQDDTHLLYSSYGLHEPTYFEQQPHDDHSHTIDPSLEENLMKFMKIQIEFNNEIRQELRELRAQMIEMDRTLETLWDEQNSAEPQHFLEDQIEPPLDLENFQNGAHELMNHIGLDKPVNVDECPEFLLDLNENEPPPHVFLESLSTNTFLGCMEPNFDNISVPHKDFLGVDGIIRMRFLKCPKAKVYSKYLFLWAGHVQFVITSMTSVCLPFGFFGMLHCILKIPGILHLMAIPLGHVNMLGRNKSLL